MKASSRPAEIAMGGPAGPAKLATMCLQRDIEQANRTGTMIDRAIVDIRTHFELSLNALGRETGRKPMTFSELNQRKRQSDTPSRLVEFLDRKLDALPRRDVETRGKIQALRQKFLEALVEGRTGINRLFSLWMDEIGSQKFKSECGVSATLISRWVNDEIDEIPTFLQLHGMAANSGHDLYDEEDSWTQEARSCWRHDAERVAEQRGICEPFAHFEQMLQMAGYKLDKDDLLRLGARPKGVVKLTRYELPSWEDVEPALSSLREDLDRRDMDQLAEECVQFLDDGGDAWQELFEEQEESAYHTLFFTLQDEKRMSFSKLADVMGVAEPDCPPMYIKTTVTNAARSPSAPLGVMNHILASGDRRQETALHEKFIDTHRGRARRSGSSLQDLRFHELLWAVGTEDLLVLAQERYPKGGYTFELLRRMEQGKCEVSASEQRDLIRLVEEIGRGKLDEPLERLARYTKPMTVAEALQLHARETPGGYGMLPDSGGGLHELVREADDPPGMIFPSGETLKKMADGKNMLPLPWVEHIVRACGAEVTDDFRANWAEQYARKLSAEWKNPLARVLRACIGEVAVSIEEFSAKPAPVSQPMVQKCLYELEGNDVPSWGRIDRILLQVGVEQDSPRWQFVECLYAKLEKGSEWDAAIQDALRAWRRRMRQHDDEVVEGYPDLLGLTSEEITGASSSAAARGGKPHARAKGRGR